MELRRIGLRLPQILRQHRGGFDRFTKGPVQHVSHLQHQNIQVDDLRFERLAARECQHLGGQLPAHFRGLHGLPRKDGLAVAGQVWFQHLQIANNHGEQIVEVMRDAAGKLADRLHLMRLF